MEKSKMIVVRRSYVVFAFIFASIVLIASLVTYEFLLRSYLYYDDLTDSDPKIVDQKLQPTYSISPSVSALGPSTQIGLEEHVNDDLSRKWNWNDEHMFYSAESSIDVSTDTIEELIQFVRLEVVSKKVGKNKLDFVFRPRAAQSSDLVELIMAISRDSEEEDPLCFINFAELRIGDTLVLVKNQDPEYPYHVMPIIVAQK